MKLSLSSIVFSLFTVLLVSCASSTPTPVIDDKKEASMPTVAVTLSSPVAGSKLSSPLTVIGTAPGTWFFEGQIPVELLASDGTSLARIAAHAQGEWMTEKEVPFQAVITFTTKATNGTLVIRKDNPSGLPENDDSFSTAIVF